MKAAALAALLGGVTYQFLALLDPLKSTLSIFMPWERTIVIGSWCAFIGAMTLAGGRYTARFKGWRAEFGIVLIGVASALVHFPRGRLHQEPPVTYEYAIGVVEMALCWIPAALIAHWLIPNNSLKRTRER
jgi:hypothetical protein